MKRYSEAAMKLFGVELKSKRIIIGMSLRGLGVRCNIDPSNLSKIEAGQQPPPSQVAKIHMLATHLNMVPGSNEYCEFLDLAHLTKGEFPPGLLETKGDVHSALDHIDEMRRDKNA